jgi:hypothetical protein
MRSAAGHNGSQRAGSTPHRQFLAQKDLHIPSANGLHIKKSVIVNILHNQSYLIAVNG